MKLKLTSVLLSMLMAGIAAAQVCPDTMWTRSFGSDSEEWAWSVVECSNGDVILGGQTAVPDSLGDSYLTLMRVSPIGEMLWSRTYENALLDVNGSFLISTSNDEFVLAGTAKLPNGTDKIVLIKVNGQGDTLWTRLSGEDSDNFLSNIHLATDGGFVAVGYVVNPNGPVPFLAKHDSAGILAWQQYYPDPPGRFGTLMLDVMCAEDGGYVLGGATWIETNLHLCLIRTNSVGDTIWTRSHEEGSLAQINRILPLPDNEFMLTGVQGSPFQDGCIFLARAASDGQLEWYRTYGCDHIGSVEGILRLTDGGFLLNGLYYQDNGAVANFDALLIRTDQFGTEQFLCTYGDSSFQEANSALIRSDGTVIMAGVDTSAVGDQNFWVVRTNPALDATSGQRLMPEDIRLLGNYPNPFNASTVIKFELDRAANVSLKVYDVLGREATTLMNENRDAGRCAVRWDASHAVSGMYFAVLQAGDVQQAMKMMLLK